MSIEIIWPEHRLIPDVVIEKWFADAIANGLVSPQSMSAKTPREMAEVLADLGQITLRKVETGE